MDKSWIKADIGSKTFKDGVQYFIDFARARSIRGIIACPCLKCCLCKCLTVDAAHVDILQYGFLPGYKTWTIHGENSIPSQLSHPNPSIVHETSVGEDDIRGLVRDALGVSSLPLNNTHESDSRVEGDINESNEEPAQSSKDKDIPYKRHLEECDKELYPVCKYSNLSFTLHFYHVKCIGGISNKCFSMLLELFRDAFPHLTSLPSSANEAKKLTTDLGLGYEKIHACPNDCMLYWGFEFEIMGNDMRSKGEGDCVFLKVEGEFEVEEVKYLEYE
ncbi:tetratricopeptide-like helical domain, DYW domain protein [Tanacetum coccineum]